MHIIFLALYEFRFKETSLMTCLADFNKTHAYTHIHFHHKETHALLDCFSLL